MIFLFIITILLLLSTYTLSSILNLVHFEGQLRIIYRFVVYFIFIIQIKFLFNAGTGLKSLLLHILAVLVRDYLVERCQRSIFL